jgi:hypothetical protein
VRQALLAHVAQRRLIDPILDVTGTQQFQKIDPALWRASITSSVALPRLTGYQLGVVASQ